MKQQMFLIKMRHEKFRGVSGEKQKKMGKMPNGLKILRRTLNTKRNKKK